MNLADGFSHSDVRVLGRQGQQSLVQLGLKGLVQLDGEITLPSPGLDPATFCLQAQRPNPRRSVLPVIDWHSVHGMPCLTACLSRDRLLLWVMDGQI